MEKPDQLHELFQMQTAINERLCVKKDKGIFKRQDREYTKRQENDPKLI
jgi:hypothetical protein